MPSLLPSISLSILHIPGTGITDSESMEAIQLEKQQDIPSAEPTDDACPCANVEDQRGAHPPPRIVPEAGASLWILEL